MKRRVALNASRMKSRNYRRILDELRISPFSRSELARRIGLTRSAISLIVDALIHDKIVVEGDTIISKTAGRSSTALHWNKDSFYSIGVAIRRNYFGVGIYDFCGSVISSVEYIDLKAPYSTRNAIFEKISQMIDSALIKNKPKGSFLGIGIGAPGPIDAEAGIIDNPTYLDVLKSAPIVDYLKSKYCCPVIMKNDACAQALAELSFGVKDTYDTFLVLEITGGIGAGLIQNGHLNSGTLGNGNELGHMTLNIFGPKCACGNTGCAELYATMGNIVAYAKSIDSRLVNWNTIVEMAHEGVTSAISVIRQEAFYIATLCINMINILDIDAIILNGREITYKPAILLSMVREQLPERKLIKRSRNIDFITSGIKENTDVLSAANLAIDNFLENLSNSYEASISPSK